MLPFHSLPTVPQRGLPLHSLREGAGAHRGSVGGLRPLPKTWGDWLSTFANPPKTSPLSPLIAFPPFVPLPPTLLHSNWCHGGASHHHALFIGYRIPNYGAPCFWGRCLRCRSSIYVRLVLSVPCFRTVISLGAPCLGANAPAPLTGCLGVGVPRPAPETLGVPRPSRYYSSPSGFRYRCSLRSHIF